MIGLASPGTGLLMANKWLIAEWNWKVPELPVDNWWFVGIVLVLLMFSIWVVARLTTSVTDDIDPAEIDRQMLTAVSELHSQGELTQDEYRSIKGRLIERLHAEGSSADFEGSSRKMQDGKQSEEELHKTTENAEDEPPAAPKLVGNSVEVPPESPQQQRDQPH